MSKNYQVLKRAYISGKFVNPGDVLELSEVPTKDIASGILKALTKPKLEPTPDVNLSNSEQHSQDRKPSTRKTSNTKRNSNRRKKADSTTESGKGDTLSDGSDS